MIRDHLHREKRSAFTLVELMVVILIIAILVSLLASAVMKALGKIPEVQTRTEIAEMEVALQAFMMDFNLTDPPPSALNLNEYNPQASLTLPFLQKMFGKNFAYNPATPGVPVPIDWNGNGVIDGPPNGWSLQGHQCLVFYLGGIPNTAGVASGLPPSPQGFSTNPANPALITPGSKTKGPYFQFVSSRLVPVAASGGFFYYQDPWQAKPVPMPYVYFSSNGNNNGYGSVDINGFVYLDCNTVTFTDALGLHFAMPYSTGPGTYTYSNTFQIISAGKDGKFGYTPGLPPPPLALNSNLWSPVSGAVGTGADDQANFSSTLLGVGQN